MFFLFFVRAMGVGVRRKGGGGGGPGGLGVADISFRTFFRTAVISLLE